MNYVTRIWIRCTVETLISANFTVIYMLLFSQRIKLSYYTYSASQDFARLFQFRLETSEKIHTYTLHNSILIYMYPRKLFTKDCIYLIIN